jgi:hypothetical protein
MVVSTAPIQASRQAFPSCGLLVRSCSCLAPAVALAAGNSSRRRYITGDQDSAIVIPLQNLFVFMNLPCVLFSDFLVFGSSHDETFKKT